MDDARQVRDLLTRLADRAVGDVEPPAVRALGRVRRRQRTGWAVVATICAVLAVVVPLAVYRGSAPPATTRPNLPWPSVAAYPTTGPATASALRQDHWSTLPAAPVAARSDAVGVWTGSRMIVWGGSADNHYFADGAAYDPGTKSWTALPPAPISARAHASYVWTGSLLFVWGGTDGGENQLTDGAVYDPAHSRWTTLPSAPAAAAGLSAAVWTGSEVVLLTTAPPDSHGAGPDVVHAQAYDPARRAWTGLPDLRLPDHHGVLMLSAVAVGQRVLVWANWSHTVPTNSHSIKIDSGVDGYTLLDGRWAPNRLQPHKGMDLTDPIWTGRELLVPTTEVWCGDCSHPPPMNVSGLRFDPRTSARSVLPHGPVSDLSASYLWTGAALLGFGTNARTGGSHGTNLPGAAAAWDPASDTWTSLPAASLYGSDPVAVWTGDSLLVWGLLYPAHGSGQPSAASGLRLGP